MLHYISLPYGGWSSRLQGVKGVVLVETTNLPRLLHEETMQLSQELDPHVPPNGMACALPIAT